ncbi:MAG: PIG-L family deacetylase [bacterium]|nr:PIG-L family deacetylase [bacterium]
MKRALAIVAHPDDETIWMGGTILNSKNIKWTIFSLCRANDPDRSSKFKKVCQCYGAVGIMSGLEDEGIMSAQESIPEIKKRISNLFRDKNFDYIFTHGQNGEYGHERHVGTHLAVKQLIRERIITCKKLFFFAYDLDSGNKIVNNKTDFSIRLDNDLLTAKKNIIERLYGFKNDSFEYLSCLPEETYENINFS